ncbi:MAG: hypothetical protein H6719_12465 [Sandaracinaceae bacterium]|nr:hypothetical protein [Sandaracinaceae bacterium]
MAWKRLGWCLAVLALGCAEGSGASLQPIGAQTVRVNEILMVTIAIDNPEGRPVELRVEAPEDLPMFDRVHSLSTEPGGAVFRWAPLPSHVGMHELTFILSTPGGGTELDRETALVEVRASDDSAPVFVRPGAGGTYDVERDPCVQFDVEVRDDDSTDVDIGTRVEPPEGATLANAGPRRATFDWCPTPDQIAAAERWTIQLYADDRDHPRVEHDYIVVLRSGPKDGCPGASPTITIERPASGEAITSGTSYPIEVSVSDDMGLRDAPLLYYTTSEPADPSMPDVTEFEQATFEPGEAGRYVARVPPLGLSVGAMQQVWFLVSATDNDDPTGSSCDHRTDSPVVSFFAVGGMPADGSLRQCDFCTASTECASGICASAAGGARCVDACSDAACTAGTCGATVTTEGGTRAGCGPLSETCGSGGGMCTDDSREDNDTATTATRYTAPITDGQICSGDEDFFAIAVGMGDEVVVTVDGFSHSAGDLDLELRAADGTILGTSASVRDSESVTYCNGDAATTLTARVFGFSSAENAYSFRADVAPDPAGCCVDDLGEDDDSRTTARTLTFTSDVASAEGTACSGDDDWLAIPMSGPGTIDVLVLFDHALGDIDIALYDPMGTRLRSAVSSTDDEMMTVDVSGGGTYTLRIYSFGARGGNDWIAEITRSLGSSCTSSLECPPDTVCDSGMCRDGRCMGTPGCPAMHQCVQAGPIPAAPRCGAACTDNPDCRAEEACKWFAEGRFCGRRGSGQNGDACSSFSVCGLQRSCVQWAGGYCARVGCTSNADCESGTYCVTEGAINVCALSCVSAPCRDAEGYSCDFTPTLGGTSRFVCLPG